MSFASGYYKSVGAIISSIGEMLQPAERLTVSQAAERYRFVNQPGAYVGPWLNITTPMMVEPMDTFTSRAYTGLIFIGPAQSGKTDSLILNTLAYSIKVEPMDMMVVCPTQAAGRDFSMRRIDRLHQHSKEIGAMQLPGADSDNKFDKHYRTGMMMTISWPTPTELAGKPIGRIVMTDYDRMPDDVGGDGNAYDLASKRTTTFGTYAMTLAESSPSREVSDLKWIPRSPHEAPPATGIFALYNRGDRRRWYWPCPVCGEYFEGKFEHLKYTRQKNVSNADIADTVYMKCPVLSCGAHILPDDRDAMQGRGKWVKDGQGITPDGTIFGNGPRTRIASFWLRGVAAVFTNWRLLVAQYLDALDDYEKTGSEDALRKFYNNDLAEPYYPKSTENVRSPEDLMARAEKSLPARKVPHGVRFLVGLIDVQNSKWVVQVFGITPGRPFDTITIDRFDIVKSKRLDEDGERLYVKPATYLEDWDEITDQVIDKHYELDDDTGRKMGIRFTACDSGGREGVTTRAYDYYRKLREEGKHTRFILLKGDSTPNQPRSRITTPDSNRRDAKAVARGDVPVLMLNPNLLKDDLAARLDCVEPGRGMYRTPDWLDSKFYAELCEEIRTPKGWENPANHRNETWDLSYYCIGLCTSSLLRVESIDWDNPPNWAAEWDANDLVHQPFVEGVETNTIKSGYDFSKFGKALA